MTESTEQVSPARETHLAIPIGDTPMRPADAKVWTIIEKMIAKTWNRGQEAEQLAIEWGCSVALVERYSSEASRFLRLIREPELIRARVLARLTEIGEQDEGDRVPALLGAAKVAGVIDGQKNPALQATTQISDDDLRELLRDPPVELVAVLEECGWRRG